MRRTVVLVDLYWTRDKDPRIPLGHSSLLSALYAAGDVDVTSIVEPVNETPLCAEQLADRVLASFGDQPAERTDVAVGVYIWSERHVQRLLASLRRRGFRGRIILGGPQISYAGPELERLYPHADAFVRGYGEHALVNLVRDSGLPDKSNLEALDRWRRLGVHFARSEDGLTIAKAGLSEFPSPWLSELVPLHRGAFLRWETQRGCPYRCSFCQHRDPGAQQKVQRTAEDRVAAEIALFCDHQVGSIAVLDPIFNLGPRAEWILHQFAQRGFAGHLSLQCRAEAVTPSFLNAASELNVTLEFGLQTIHESESRLIERKNKLAVVERAFQQVRERNIAHEVSLIFGLPSQTLGSFRETVGWCLDRRIPVIKAFPLMLLRGTELDRQRAQFGLVEGSGTMPVVVSSDSFSRSDWVQMDKLSKALKLTEGSHPRTIDALDRRCSEQEARRRPWSSPRWQPTM